VTRQSFAVALALMAVLALPGCRPQTLTGDDASQFLSQLPRARGEVNLKGKLTTSIRLGDGQTNAEATIHRGQGRMQLQFTSGRAGGVKIIEQDGAVWRLNPDGSAVRRLERNPLDVMPPSGKNAVVTVTRGARIAGRPTDSVVVQPRPGSTARVEMWLDRETKFPLALYRYNNDGVLVSSTRYTEVDFSAPPPQPVTLPKGSDTGAQERAAVIDRAKAAQVLGRQPLEPRYLPQGFDLQGYYLHTRPRGQAVVLRYADGVRLLHVVEMKVPRLAGRSGAGVEGGQAQRGRRGALQQRWQQRRQTPGENQPQAGRPRAGQQPAMTQGQAGGWGQEVMLSRLRGKIIRFRVDDLMIAVAGDIQVHELRKVADSMRGTGVDF